jgi:surfactin synthase thioesterase subunit
MNELKLEQKFAIVGFSMGGGIVMRYVAKYYPKTLSHVVFMGAAAPSFTKRDGYPHGQDRAFCDQIITGLMQNSQELLLNLVNCSFAAPNLKGQKYTAGSLRKVWQHLIMPLLVAQNHCAMKIYEMICK